MSLRLLNLWSQPSTRMLGLQYNEPWSSELPSNTERVKPSLCLSGMHGIDSSPPPDFFVNIPMFQLLCDMVSMQASDPSLLLLLPLTITPCWPSQMYLQTLLITSFSVADTSDPFPDQRQSHYWDLSSLHHSPSSLSQTGLIDTALYKISLFPTAPLPRYRPSTTPLTQQYTPVPGVPSLQYPSSLHGYQSDPKRLSVMLPKLIEQSHWPPHSGPASLYIYRKLTLLLLIHVMVLVLLRVQEYMAQLAMLAVTSFEHMVLALCRSGWMTISFSGFLIAALRVTTAKEINGGTTLR
jgi:hypothetical protein